LITLLAVLLTFFIVMPVMGFMYLDLMHLREATRIELERVKKLRREIQEERWSQFNN
jgi:hypothetical protein